MSPDYLTYFSFAILSIIFSYLLGHFFCYFLIQDNSNKLYSVFKKLLIGNVAMVSSYAILKSNGNTILFGIVPLFIIWFLFKKETISKNMSC